MDQMKLLRRGVTVRSLKHKTQKNTKNKNLGIFFN